MSIDRGWRARLRYRANEFIGGGAGKQLAFLAVLTVALVGGFTLVGLVLGLGVEDGWSGNLVSRTVEVAWFYFGRVLDAGTFTTDQGLVNRVVSTFASILGVVVAGLLISALAGNFQQALEEIRRDGGTVMEDGHFLILGWSEKIYSVIEQLAEAYAQKGRITVVVMAERDKVEMEDRLASKLSGQKRVKLVVRSGSSVALDELSKVSFDRAEAIVVLIDDKDVDEPDTADARIMKTLLAIFNHPSVRGQKKVPRVTAEVMQSHNQELAVIASSGAARVVKTNEMISKIILQTARIAGLSLVYDELLRFEGNEIHFKRAPEVVGQPFGDVLLDFPNGMVVGVAKSDGSGHVLNPPASHRIGPDEELLILAEDSRIEYKPFPRPIPQMQAIGSNAQKRVEHMLILGWNPKIFPLIREFDDYVAKGSTLTLVNSLDEEARAELLEENVGETNSVTLRHLVGQFTSRSLMDQLQPQNYPTVMVLGDAIESKSAEDADTRAIIALLLLRDARRRTSLAPTQRISSEILDPKNRELAATTQINDIVVSNEMVSMVLAQITYEPRVQAVLEDLLRSEGSEIYVKPLEFYSQLGQPTTVEHLVLAAKARGELMLGVQVVSGDAEKKFGLTLNPRERKSALVPKPGDKLIVLAEEDG
jgi:ion channel POLLUX/CASTOR